MSSNATEVVTSATWRPESSFRGTFTILSACLGTLTICVWSAVHSDIPSRKSDRLWSFVNKMGWLLVGLLAPELLLFIAYNQRLAAMKLLDEARKHLRCLRTLHHGTFDFSDAYLNAVTSIRKRDPQHTRKYTWRMMHAFYGCMGGYTFDFPLADDANGEPFLPGGETRVSITSHGIRFLLQYHPDLIPDISEDSISDRSKADSLAKTILLGQVVRFCLNCISRGIQGLPLSLLEVSTVAHAICTLFTYLVWWEKSLNVSEPTLIGGIEARKACALMAMCSTPETYLLSGVLCFSITAEMTHLRYSPAESREDESSSAQASSIGPSTPSIIGIIGDSGPSIVDEDTKLDTVDFTVNVTSGSPARTAWMYRTIDDVKALIAYGRRPWPWYLEREDIVRWSLASSAIRTYGEDCLNFLSPPYPPFFHALVKRDSSLQGFANSDIFGFTRVLRPRLAAAVLLAIYGLPHFIGWFAHFPTSVERILWRAATAVLTGYGIVMGTAAAMAIGVPIKFLPQLEESRSRPGEKQILALSAVIYISSSAYLVIESFRQLLYLPTGAYELPAWSNYWPHFS
ncbi:hypothetical protein NEOLEDRAFT_1147670 [Neolentinus lepideus HHB14362 ss-1]|uniref:Uncharacterized protein n=1 Tax=Neolentinus lepideus HHB14362 ss-1 TaxID=1314782 RepID=A0A165T0D5_9AGAM|nr:hypothetical protein NEOLEDRAFT_1147670 [Neolentinus lepideus HHB14362 ss-1]